MKVAIIGTGNMGTGFAKSLANTKHQVFIGSRNTEKARKMAEEIGGDVRSGSYQEAAEFADVIILAVPWHAMRDALNGLGDVSGKVMVDICNPLTKDFSGLDVGFTTSAAEEIAKLTDAKVVKAFNTIFAEVLQNAVKFNEGLANVFICGDDKDAKEEISELSRDLGYEPIDAGSLSAARWIEPLGMLNINLGYMQKMGTKIAFRLMGK